MTITTPPYVQEILARLEAAGHAAYLVGGCVRDALLGRVPEDWDICTGATPQEARQALAGIEVIGTGLAHGTVTAVIDHHPVEITTFRLDGAYSDHRRPDSVSFTDDLAADLGRRDFTVNAMAYHPARGLADPYDGAGDLRNKILRCVGDPGRRFEEDALRILRALRFSAALGFSLEKNTAQAVAQWRGALRYVAAERAQKELTRLLCGPDARRVLLEHKAVIFTLLPQLEPLDGFEQHTPWHCYDIWGHTCAAVGAIPPEPLLRWAALLHDSGKPERFFMENGQGHFHGHPAASERIAREIFAQLKCPKKLTETACLLIQNHELRILEHPEPKRIKRLLGQFGEEALLELLELTRADILAQAPGKRYRLAAYAPMREEILRLSREGACVTRKQLAVNGNDLLPLGLRGPALGRALGALLEEVLEGRAENTRDGLLEAARHMQNTGRQ
ncbi:MAG: HD domain-containing protein [Oscillospiraceae bacterium]|jgi:tRNA nucleotidyltransferase (CCA-adding enzyme)|nr:HD domain-containing protein [Oscillospiraceae bacterium]